MNEDLVRLQPLNPNRDSTTRVQSFSLETPSGLDEPNSPEWASVGILGLTMADGEVVQAILCCGSELTSELGLGGTPYILGTLRDLLNNAVLCLSLDYGIFPNDKSTAGVYLISPPLRMDFIFDPDHREFREKTS